MGKELDIDNFELAEAIANCLVKHPKSYYSTTLEDSHIPLHEPKLDFFGDPFCEVFNSYNAALFDSIRVMIRYEKSLKVWNEIASQLNSEIIRNTLIMDYVHPVFVVLCDTPNAFKDRLVRGCVKLTAISKGDSSFLVEKDVNGKTIRRDWFKDMGSICSESSLGKQLCAIVTDELYKCQDATHFRQIHGAGVHDLSPTLVSGVSLCSSPGDGAAYQCYREPFDLGKELEIADRQRLRMQKAYSLFCEYADWLQDESD
jgi:hypothetical protein